MWWENIFSGNEDEKKKVSNALNQLGDDLKASKEELKVSLEPLIRVTDEVEDVKKRIKQMEDAQEELLEDLDDIKPVKEVSEKMEQELEDLKDKVSHLKNDLEDRKDDVNDCQEDLKKVKDNCENTEKGLANLNNDMEKIKQGVEANTKNIDELQINVNLYMDSRDESDGLARNEFQEKMDAIEAKLKDQERTVDNCSKLIQDNTNNLAPLLEFEGAKKDEVQDMKKKIQDLLEKLSTLEENLHGRCENLQVRQNKLQEVEREHFTSTEQSLEHLKDALNKLNSDWDGLVLALEQQDNHMKGESKSWKEKMAALEDQLKKVRDGLENHVLDSKSTNKEIQSNLKDAKEDLVDQGDTLKKAKDQLKDLSDDFEKVKEALKDLKNDTSDDIEKLTDQTNSNLEKIIALEENNYNQQQRVDIVESLNRRVDLIHEQKQMSEAKLLEDLKSTEQSNSNRLAELQELLQSRIVDLEDQSQTLEKDVKALEQKVEKHDVSLENLNVDGQAMKDNLKKQGIDTDKNRSRIEDCENKLSDMKSRVDGLADNVHDLDQDVSKLDDKISDLNQRALDELLKRCDQELHKIKAQSEKNEKHVENLRHLNNKLLEEIRSQVEFELNKYSSLADDIRNENQYQLKEIEDRLTKLCDTILDQCSSDIAELQGSDRKLLDKIENTEKLIDSLKAQLATLEGRDNRKEVEQIQEKISILQLELEAERGRVNATEAMVQNLESNHGILQDLTVHLKDHGIKLDERINDLIEDNEKQLQSIENSLSVSFNTIGKCRSTSSSLIIWLA